MTEREQELREVEKEILRLATEDVRLQDELNTWALAAKATINVDQKEWLLVRRHEHAVISEAYAGHWRTYVLVKRRGELLREIEKQKAPSIPEASSPSEHSHSEGEDST